jgi:hypothetical protein
LRIICLYTQIERQVVVGECSFCHILFLGAKKGYICNA